nr:hypothetical protein [Vibrio cholerae]
MVSQRLHYRCELAFFAADS